MQKAVEEYLNRVRADAEDAETKARDEQHEEETEYREFVLTQVGLVEREYESDELSEVNFPYFDDERNKHYREVPIEVSDEEWEAVRKAYEASQSEEAEEKSPRVRHGGNTAATLLRIFAYIIFLGGAVISLALGQRVDIFTGETSFSFASALVYWSAFFVAGTMMYGFAEIVRLLQVIADK